MIEVKKWSVKTTDKDGWNSRLIGFAWQASTPTETGHAEERWLWLPPFVGQGNAGKGGKGGKGIAKGN